MYNERTLVGSRTSVPRKLKTASILWYFKSLFCSLHVKSQNLIAIVYFKQFLKLLYFERRYQLSR